MARNDGIHRTVARNNNLSASQINNAQRHNEREKESYTNPDIVRNAWITMSTTNLPPAVTQKCLHR